MKTTEPRICRGSDDAIRFWRSQVPSRQGFNSHAETFWVIGLDAARLMIGVHQIGSRALGNAERLADEVFEPEGLRGACESIFVHYRPGAVRKPDADEISRAGALILASRAKRCPLLDFIVIGRPDFLNQLGAFSLRRLKGFSSSEPFAKRTKGTLKPAGNSHQPSSTQVDA